MSAPKFVETLATATLCRRRAGRLPAQSPRGRVRTVTASSAQCAPSISKADIQDDVLDMAHLLGWRVAS